MQKDKALQEEILRISGQRPEHCMRCGKCSASCPAYGEMDFPPHLFVYMVEKGDIAPLQKADSLYHCLTCLACVERCPRGVEPANLVEAVRALTLREQGAGRMSQEEMLATAEEKLPQQALTSAMRKYVK